MSHTEIVTEAEKYNDAETDLCMYILLTPDKHRKDNSDGMKRNKLGLRR